MQPQPPYSNYPPQPYSATYPGYPYPPASNVIVNVQQKQPSFLIRVLYYIFIGSWFGYLWLCVGFGFCALIVTLPVGLAMLNRLPTVLTLRSATSSMQTYVTTGPGAMYVNVQQSGPRQSNFVARALYFLFIGCWLGFLYANIAYLLCLLIVTLPAGLMMLNRLPAVLTLRKN